MKRLALLALVSLGACTGHAADLSVQAPATYGREPSGFERAIVRRAVDGDTLEVEVVGRTDGPGAGDTRVGGTYRVRLTGIDTPESVDPRRPVECYGKEAAAATAALLEGRRVRMVRDVEDRDRYERLLRYVYLGAEMANARLVVNGYAAAYTYPPNVRWSSLFVELQKDARENDRGLWSPDSCEGES